MAERHLNLRDRINGDRVWSGHPRRMYSPVCRSLSALTPERYVERFKIGITNDPIRRFGIYVDAYDEMILLYRSRSINNVSDMEAMLIDHNRDLAMNRTGGGGGNIGRTGPYYLYVVLYQRREGNLASLLDFVSLVVPNVRYKE